MKLAGLILSAVCLSANAANLGPGLIDCEGVGTVSGTYVEVSKEKSVEVDSLFRSDASGVSISRITNVTSPSGKFGHIEHGDPTVDWWEMKGYKQGQPIELTVSYDCARISFDQGKATRAPMKWNFLIGPGRE